MRWLDNITDSVDVILNKLWEIVEAIEARRAAVHGVEELDMTWQLNKNKNWEKMISHKMNFYLAN